MELYQLRSFAAVAESGHLTRAADRLHISQPALSAQIKALEDELGVALFERLPSGMELTPAGRRLLPEAHKVVAAAQVLRSHASAFKGEVAGRVRVGTVSDPEFIRVGDLLAQAVDTFPLLEIELHNEVSGAAFEKVRDGELDASFYYGNLTHPTVAAHAAAQCRLPRRRAGGVARARRERAVGRDRRDAVGHDAADQHAQRAGRRTVPRARRFPRAARRGRPRGRDQFAGRGRTRRHR